MTEEYEVTVNSPGFIETSDFNIDVSICCEADVQCDQADVVASLKKYKDESIEEFWQDSIALTSEEGDWDGCIEREAEIEIDSLRGTGLYFVSIEFDYEDKTVEDKTYVLVIDR